MNKKIVLLSGINFNNASDAAASRMINYSKSLKKDKIDFLFTSINEEKIYNLNDNLELITYEGDKNSTVIKNNSKIYSLLLREFDFIKSLRYLIQIETKFNKNNNCIYLYYPYTFALTITTLIYLRVIKRRIVFIEKNELEFAKRLNYQSPIQILDKLIFILLQIILIPIEIFEDLLTIFFNGIIVISTNLNRLYKKFSKNVILIPILSDPPRIIPKKWVGKNDKFNIGFFGAIADNKDKIFDLINVIGKNAFLKNSVKLNLYGPFNKSTSIKLNNLLTEYRLHNTIFIKGTIPHKMVLDEMVKHDLLVLLRPPTLQTELGLPTKLADYTSSGVPVLTTDVSDIPLYFVDHESIFLLNKKTLSESSIKSSLLEIMSLKKDDLKKIGIHAFEVCKRNFYYLNYTEKLKKLILS